MAGKQLQILATKVVPPRCGAGLIDRPRLLGLAGQALGKQVSMIKGGAGFGKTSLAVAWAEALQRSGHVVAWLALDSDDDEPVRFFFYMGHALRRASDAVGTSAIDLLSEVSLVAPKTVAVALINDLADVENEIFLFLDDFHHITDPEVHNGLAYFLKYGPSQFHLIVTTRVEGGLPVADLRAHHNLLEIDTAALRFDLEETRRFIENETRVDLDPADAKALHDKTEGWPAVLRIVASTSSQSTQNLSEYMRRLSGSHRPIGAYLADLLDVLPYEVVQFMLRTAILERFTAPLCEAVTGIKASHQILAFIEDRQIMLVPLDHEHRWFRYHSLLAGHLRQRLETQASDGIPKLHRLAYRWYATQSMWTEAVQHAIAAGDTSQAMAWVQSCAMGLVTQGDLLKLLGWQRLFPTELMRGQITVRLAIAWGLALAMRFEETLTCVSDIERDVAADPAQMKLYMSKCLCIRSVALSLKDDTHAALEFAEKAMAGTADKWTANVASNVARLCYWKSGDFGRFYTVPWIPYSEDEERHNVFSSIYRLCLQGMAEFYQAKLDVAVRYYEEAARLAAKYAGPNSASTALPASLIAQIRYEQGDLAGAEDAVIDSLPLISSIGMLECVASTYLVLTRAAIGRGNMDRAHALLDQAEHLGESRGWGRLIAIVLAQRTRLLSRAGRLVEAAACVHRLEQLVERNSAPAPCAWTEIGLFAAVARANLAARKGQVDEAVAILRPIRDRALSEERRYWGIYLTVRLAVFMAAGNARAGAADEFRRALTLGASTGIRQTILDLGSDGGSEIAAFLSDFQESARRDGASQELMTYANALLDRWNQMQSGVELRQLRTINDVLSPREVAIVDLIRHGQSNKEIARQLGITPETVKTHVKNIFSKLGVEKRAQAVLRAQALGLIGGSTKMSAGYTGL
jgi:LuxR family maltose regulon positive regulatory protein